jgi:hypothetical protein
MDKLLKELKKGDVFCELVNGVPQKEYTVTDFWGEAIKGERFDKDGNWEAGVWLDQNTIVRLVNKKQNTETSVCKQKTKDKANDIINICKTITETYKKQHTLTGEQTAVSLVLGIIITDAISIIELNTDKDEENS